MELRQYWKIARRWWWLILLPPVVAALYGLATYQAPAGGYALTLRYTASQPASGSASPNYDPNYYRWLTSEYIVTALRDWVRSSQFAAVVFQELLERSAPTTGWAISGADNARSILVVFLWGSDSNQLVTLGSVVTTVLQERNAEIFPQLGGQAAQVVRLDSFAPAPVAPSLRARLDLPLKVGLGLMAGVGLALLAHYLDPFVREREELARMGLSVIGEIPKARRTTVDGGRK
jgi:hypothetical protein